MTLSLTENMFWVFLQLHWKLRALYHKKTAIWFYCCKMRCLKLYSIQNMFCFVNNNIELPWAIYHKKKAFLIFLFFVAETRWNQLYKRKSIFGLFAAKLCCCQRYCTWEKFSSSLQQNYPGFYFILLKTTFLLVSG